MLIDTHAHLNDVQFADVKNTIQNAIDRTVEIMICSGNDVSTSQQAVAMANEYENVFETVGIHPQDVTTNYLEELKEIQLLAAQNQKVVAIGEIGLEYREGCPDKVLQQQAFLAQVKLAHTLHLPIVIHCRDAIGDMLQILREHRALLSYGGTFHCFSESLESAKTILDLGLYISIGGVVTFKNAKRLQEVVSKIPLERIILETDCPYLAPEPHRGHRNEPAYIPLIAEKVADLQQVSADIVASITSANARRLFGI